jgi:hypothetical protein
MYRHVCVSLLLLANHLKNEISHGVSARVQHDAVGRGEVHARCGMETHRRRRHPRTPSTVCQGFRRLPVRTCPDGRRRSSPPSVSQLSSEGRGIPFGELAPGRVSRMLRQQRPLSSAIIAYARPPEKLCSPSERRCQNSSTYQCQGTSEYLVDFKVDWSFREPGTTVDSVKQVVGSRLRLFNGEGHFAQRA